MALEKDWRFKTRFWFKIFQNIISKGEDRNWGLKIEDRRLKNKDWRLAIKDKKTKIKDQKLKVKGQRSNLEGRISKVKSQKLNLKGRISKVESRNLNLEGRILKVESRKSKIESIRCVTSWVNSRFPPSKTRSATSTRTATVSFRLENSEKSSRLSEEIRLTQNW